ncbi:hypothetical protein, variant, partial [Sphaeroforma arctica JP610]
RCDTLAVRPRVHSALKTIKQRKCYSHTLTTGPGVNEPTVVSGTRYEEHVQAVLHRYMFDLDRVGGANDKGADLAGSWHLPSDAYENRTDNQSSLDKNTRVMVQCKNYKKKLGPVHVREIEGALGGRAQKTVGLLVTPKGFSPMCISRSDSSAYPLALIVARGDRPYKGTNTSYIAPIAREWDGYDQGKVSPTAL